MNATKSSQAFPLSLWSARLPTQRRRSSVIWERTLSNKLGSVMPFNNSVSVLFTAPVPSRLIEPSAASDANNDGAPSIFRSTETPVMLLGSIIFLASRDWVGIRFHQLQSLRNKKGATGFLLRSLPIAPSTCGPRFPPAKAAWPYKTLSNYNPFRDLSRILSL